LADCPIPGARGSLQPEGSGANGVLLLGEALGDHEREDGLPFRPQAPAGSVLERAIRRCGFSRPQFVLWNVVPTQPPRNFLEGAPYEDEAIAWGLPQCDDIVQRFQPRVVLCLGNVALRAATGLSNILTTRGYPVPSRWPGVYAIGAPHPSFLRRGAMAYLGVLMHDIRFAAALSACIYGQPIGAWDVDFWSPVLWRQVRYRIVPEPGVLSDPYVPEGYILYATEERAEEFLQTVAAEPSRLIAYDIETPMGKREDEEVEDEDITSIQFSAQRDTGIFLPWREPFRDIARRLLELPNPKVGANNWRFDDPRLRAYGCVINGESHDLRWAWKHFQPDLSGALQFIASFYCPELGPWIHLDRSHPQFYGIRDADATLRCL